ncbi:MAG TPA: hypothetical protein PKE04_04885 [Clostridia bacterium]|nr:hypothetical protein [Clostridia bacterium]
MSDIVLTVIGGGSVNWMRGLMRDVYMIEEIEGGEIRLVDPKTDYAEAVADMLRRYNQLKNKRYRVRVVPDRREALDGADFVMCTFSPGSLDAFWNDLEIPIRYGIRLPVSMTVGIPGLSAAIRTVPVAYEIAEDMSRLCPDAWLLSVTNPMTAVTKAYHLGASPDLRKRIVGLCHEFHAFPQYARAMLGLEKPADMETPRYLYEYLPAQGLDYTVAGINHFIWLTRARLNGRDVLPDIRRYCETHESLDTGGEGQATSGFTNKSRVKFLLCRQFGYLALPGDRHLVEFYPSLCNIQNGWGMAYGVCKTTLDERRALQARSLAQIRENAAGESAENWTRSGEEMCEIIRAVATGRRTTAILNLPNQGQIANLPMGSIVETLAEVDREGVTPKPSGDMPGAIGSLCRLHLDIIDMAVKAALDGDRRLLVEAMSLDPSGGTADFAKIPALCDELLMANRQWLPRFFS